MILRHLFLHLRLRHVLLLVLLSVLLATLGACSGLTDSEPTPIRITATPAPPTTPEPTRTPTVTPDPLIAAATALPPDAIGPLYYPAGINPLTGLAVAPAALDRRPLIVKISNAPDVVRPQAGIGQADLVFEHYVEGSLTRFSALFWSHTPPRVGSVRSARLIDLQLPQMYGALFAYSGANAIIQQRITEQPFGPRAYEGVSTGEPLYYRDPGIEMPHNLFTVPAEVWARAARDGSGTPPDLRGMVFSAAPPPSDQRADYASVDYGPDLVEWFYSADSGTYQRVVNDAPHLDANTNAQVSAANVIVLYAPHPDDPDIVAGEWAGEVYYHFAIPLADSGPVVLCRDGQRIEGIWKRLRDDGPLTFWTDDTLTQPLLLKPGNTWIEVVPLDFTQARFE